ncbi:MAG: DEAD/DEAH box helicase family protein [Defluviitaleaceae bacterium]|nr:DEAD/DEAH box helicase family protein [Defluviitaleaceae bacterium]MCL2273987.1 DEAD/DEAH box helicase family protein [Defluviitaleaceae bacterium]
MSELLKKSEMSEEDIKLRYITPAIECKWDKHNQMRMEQSFTDGRVIVRGNITARGKRKKADYILYYKRNLPLAIVEAKDNKHSVGAGMQQGIEYAEILDIPFVYSSNGDAFLERDMKNGIEREIALADFPTPDELWKRYIGEREITPEQEKLITEPYYFQIGDKTPRYYQRVAINRAVGAVARGQNRILLVMATGTGKTYTAFQIIHRLWKSGAKKKTLFLADRNILVDQTMQQDFKPFEKIMTKISGKKLDSSFELYLALYQQLAGDDGDEPFREFKPEFFDLIIIDECHRGSAREESRWRKILEYFNGATQIGMTATPKATKEVSNIDYFGMPIYTYSLKQGIDDGFLAPYKVIRVGIDKDLEGWRPPVGKVDMYGNEIEDREYNIKDYDRNLIIDDRTKTVAKRISDFLRNTHRFDKTIVFCVDIDHAERMRQALVNENADLAAENSKYVMQITGDNDVGKAQLDYFIDEESKYPVIVTTSKLMTTGVDCKTCKLIVLDNNINSMTEFKQIIGRGTRLKPEYFIDDERHTKEYFTIMDFRDACRLFADPDFDGDPIPPDPDDGEGDDGEAPDTPPTPNPPLPPDGDGDKPPKPRIKYRVNDVEVTIINERVQYYDKDGKLITESVTDYSKKNILGGYATLDVFLRDWNASGRKLAIIDELKECGVLLEALREAAGNRDIDDFDLICHIAFDKKPLTKAERVANVRKRDYLNRYEGIARDVLSALLDKYAASGLTDLEKIDVLKIDPFRKIATARTIVNVFGGKEKYIEAIRELQNQIYAEAA